MPGDIRRYKMGELTVEQHADDCPVLNVIPSHGMILPFGAEFVICTCNDPEKPHCERCGAPLRQIPAVDAYSCLKCGHLEDGKKIHGGGRQAVLHHG